MTTPTLRRVGRDPMVEMYEIDAGPGPTVVILGGVHGDEYEGTLIAARVVAEADTWLQAGRLRVVPVANPSAYAVARRESEEDGADLARSFPGAPDGTWSDRLASLLAAEVIAGADLLVDVHSAGERFAMPLLAGAVTSGPLAVTSVRAAVSLGVPWVWLHPEIAPGRTLSSALAAGVAPVYIECPGGPAPDLDVVAEVVRCLREMLATFGMATPTGRGPTSPSLVMSGGDLDVDVVCSAYDGLFLPTVAAGDTVETGDVVGHVLDPRSPLAPPHRVTSPLSGVVMFLRRSARVRVDDRVAAIAVPATHDLIREVSSMVAGSQRIGGDRG